MDQLKPFQVQTETLCELSFYTEGPVADQQGNYYFTGLAGGEVYRLDAFGSLSVWTVSDCPNGQALYPDGRHVICDSKRSAVRMYDTAGYWIRDIVAGHCAGMTVDVPNDVVIDQDGGIYFTDSVRQKGKVFYIAPDGIQFLLAEGLDYPNGLVLSADETALFIAESYGNCVRKLTLSTSGVVFSSEVWADLPRHASGRPEDNLPDGLALDSAGRLWVAHYGMGALQVISPDGRLSGSVPTGLPLTSNVCVLPGDPMQLLVTGGYGEPGPGALVRVSVSG